MPLPPRFTPEQLAQQQAIQQSIQKVGLGGQPVAPSMPGLNPFFPVQNLMPTSVEQPMDPGPNMGMSYQQDMMPRQPNPEAAMMAQRFMNAQTGYNGMQAAPAAAPAMETAPPPEYGADPSVLADTAPARIFDRLGEVNGGVRPTPPAPEPAALPANPRAEGLRSRFNPQPPEPSAPSMTAPNPYGELMGGTGWQREPGLRSTFGINDQSGGAIPVGRDALFGARDPSSPWPSASAPAPAAAPAAASTDWTQGIERPDTNWIQGIQAPAAQASNAQESGGWMDRLNEPLPGSDNMVPGYGSGSPLTGKGALAAAGVAALGAYLVNRNRKKKGKQKVSQILAARR